MVEVYQQEGLDFYELAKSVIQKYLHHRTKDSGFIMLPGQSFNPLRQQYDAMNILSHISSLGIKNSNIKFCLVNVDIYSHGMNFIFGLANPVKNAAVVSTYRLAGEKETERISKEIIHEIGHLLGLNHCADNKCIMFFSNTVNDTDFKDINFCKKCWSKIE